MGLSNINELSIVTKKQAIEILSKIKVYNRINQYRLNDFKIIVYVELNEFDNPFVFIVKGSFKRNLLKF